MRDQPLNTRLDRRQHLPDIRVGQYRFAQFKYQRLFCALAVCEVTRDFENPRADRRCRVRR